ncbi:MAG TPA: VOC family protein [Lysobacter sp.]
MSRQLFVNLPVRDLDRSVAFFRALGFDFNPKFTDRNAACMLVGEHVQVMLLVEPFFAGFTKKPVADARAATEVLLALSLGSRAEVEAFVVRAVENGAATPMAPRDMGFMYQHGFEDLDGHQWEVFHMDESQFPGC